MGFSVSDLVRLLGSMADVALAYYQESVPYTLYDKSIELKLKSLDKMEELLEKMSPLTSIFQTELRDTKTEGKTVKSEVSTFTREEGAEYTRRMALEHLVAAEDHLRSTAVGKDVKLCVTCLLENHLPALAMYAKEGKKFCRTPEECRAYEMLGEKVEKVKGEIKKVLEVEDEGERRKLLEEMAEELRQPRKMLSPAKEAIPKGEAKTEECPVCKIDPSKLVENFCKRVGDKKCKEIFEKLKRGELKSEDAVDQLKQLIDSKGYAKEQVRDMIRDSLKESSSA